MPGQRKKVKRSIEFHTIQLRNSLWPDAGKRIWDHKTSDGWLNIPRTMPLILRIIDSQSKGQPVSSTYLDLWCRTFNNGFVTMSRQSDMPFFSGFDGERAQRTWLSRIKKLHELGFIDVKEGPSGAISYVLIENPYRAIKKLHDKGLVYERFWNTLYSRMIEIGANDLDNLVEISNQTKNDIEENILCPICLNDDFEYLGCGCNLRRDVANNVYYFNCDICGEFDLSIEAIKELRGNQKSYTKAQRSAISHKFKINTREGKKQENSIRTADLECKLKDMDMPDRFEQSNEIIRYVGDQYKKHAKKLNTLPADFHSIIGSPNRNSAIELLLKQRDENLLKCDIILSKNEPKGISLTPDGLLMYDQLFGELD